MYDISVFECIWCLDGVEAILKPDMTHVISCRNVICIEHTSSAVVVAL